MVKEAIEKSAAVIAAASFLVGIILCKLIKPGWVILLGSLLFLIFMVYAFRKTKLRVYALLILITVVCGMLDYSIAENRHSSLDAEVGRHTSVDCVVIGDGIKKLYYTQYDVRLTGSGEKAFLRMKGKKPLQYGNHIRVYGEVIDIRGVRNPGDFDFRSYYKSKGFYKILEGDRVEVINAKGGSPIGFFLHASKMKVKNVVYSALPEKEAALMYGIITGDKTDMEEETREAYSKAGLSHILSVSGLHVGFLLVLINFILKPFKLGTKIESIIAVSVVFYYIMIIGAPSPALRAFIMLMFLLAAKLYKRKYDLLTSVSAAMLLILLPKPTAIFDPGFVISFGCMYSIALLYEPIYKKLGFLPAALRSSLALSLSVWLGITPVLIYYFNYVSLISIAANLAAIPLSFVITVMGFIGVIIGCISHLASIYIFSVCYYALKLLNCLTITSAGFPFAGFNMPRLPFYLWLLYYAVVLQLTFAHEALYGAYRKEFIAATVLLAAAAIGLYNLPSNDMRLVFLDVGQGDSSCITTPWKKVVLIDGGGSAKSPGSTFDVGRDITVPALLHMGVWKVDTIVVSHIHDDHIQGLLEVVKVFKVKRIIFPRTGFDSENTEKLLEACKARHVKVTYLSAGDSLKLGSGISMNILWPGEELVRDSTSDENNNSLVGRLEYKGFSALFAGDIQSEAETLLLDRLDECSILKVPHHGSPYSSTESFVSLAAPKFSIIEVGKNNFGHPSAGAISRLMKAGSKVYRVDKSGAVEVVTNGRKIKLKTVVHD